MGIRSRLVAATMAVVTLTAVAGVATASASPTPAASPSASAPGKPGSPGGPGKPGGGVASATLTKVAASLHVSVQRLTTALGHLKQALVRGEARTAAVAGFAKELGVSVARAEQALQQVSGAGGQKTGVPEAAIQLLASKLHISVALARTVIAELTALPDTPGDITTSPGFVAIATKLGITPQRLRAVVIEIKQELAGKPAPGGSPTK